MDNAKENFPSGSTHGVDVSQYVNMKITELAANIFYPDVSYYLKGRKILSREGGFWKVGRLAIKIHLPRIEINWFGVFGWVWNKYIENFRTQQHWHIFRLGPISIRFYDVSTNNNYRNQQEK